MPTFCFVCSFVGLSGRIPECFQRGTYPIEETGPCNDCPEYVTKLIGLWSDCILDALENSIVLSPDNPIGQMRSTSVYCGIGRRYHSLVCTDAHGRNVSALTCNAFGMHLRSGLLNAVYSAIFVFVRSLYTWDFRCQTSRKTIEAFYMLFNALSMVIVSTVNPGRQSVGLVLRVCGVLLFI